MIIEEKDFRLIPIGDSDVKYDLELLYKVQPRNGEARMEFKNTAYGISLDYAIEKIAQYRVSNNHKEEALTLKEYFTEYKKEIESLMSLK